MSGDRTPPLRARSALTLLCAGLLAVPPAMAGHGDDDVPRIVAGLVPAGEYRVWCSMDILPADAVALAGRPPREIEVGETGTIVQTYTEVVRVDGERRRTSLLTEGTCTTRLRAGGYYEITRYEDTLHWAWLPHPEGIGTLRTTLADRRKTARFFVRAAELTPRPELEGGHPCDGTEMRGGDTDAEAEMLRTAIVAALAEQGARIGPEHVIVRRDGLLHFSVRMAGQTGQPLHMVECELKEVEEGNLDLPLRGALHVLFGGVQHASGQTRVHMRVVHVETGVVVDAGMGQASGTVGAAIGQAAGEAASQIDFDVFGW